MKSITLSLALFVSFGLFAAKNVETIKHQVQPKETLFRLSLMYNSTVSDIVKANPGINPKSVKYGSVIKVPTNTKMRDAEFVASFLNPKMEFTPVAQVTKEVRTESINESRLVIREIPVPVQEEKSATSEAPAQPVIKSAELIPMAETPIEVAASGMKAEEENPFLTPSEIRTGPVADEQPVKEENISEPASADNGQPADDENPFMSPKPKNDNEKSASKP